MLHCPFVREDAEWRVVPLVRGRITRTYFPIVPFPLFFPRLSFTRKAEFPLFSSTATPADSSIPRRGE